MEVFFSEKIVFIDVFIWQSISPDVTGILLQEFRNFSILR
jgi:hypothetical protein